MQILITEQPSFQFYSSGAFSDRETICRFDSSITLAACLIISYNGISLLKDVVNELLDVAPSKEYEEKIRTVARFVEGVFEIEKCLIRKIGLHRLIDIQVEVDANLPVWQGHEIAHRVKVRRSTFSAHKSHFAPHFIF